MPALGVAPFPNALGERIREQISQQAWGEWLEHARMLINEHSLKLSDPAARAFLQERCEAFLFAGETAPPPGYVPPAGSVRLVRKPPSE